ncbi:TadE/TadG family type IV pilus assembly protein [Amphiplicatus metriothermophilus]|uniref:TadE-like protein n=1 Tax=Amphiplicatus metriothermophilus TaxID=1519374 RepID=A0A239PKE1_9PROT|nr:TadE/TadG family type IV pilus assembly protein [Amphiplicatus metriothermophilus]MBB5517621.1 hypothetical protein [Amphiplicatus metriothermophilus]SNT68045.1 TadE-like protein [Amphiplicatus metriothermophilus]
MFAALFRPVRRFLASRRATSATEFAFTAPFLLGGVVVMTDFGLAFGEQMNLDQAVRAGAEFVMSNVTDEATIEEFVTAAATGYSSDAPENVDNTQRPEVDVIKTCECPDATGVPCDQICMVNLRPPSTFYDITATKTYHAMFIPEFTLTAQIRVQAR